MTERFGYPPTADHAARVSIDSGGSTATFTDAALSGFDWAAAELWIYPEASSPASDDDKPYFVGNIADLSPNEDDYENLELPLFYTWNGPSISSAKFRLIPSIAMAQGSTIAAVASRFIAFLQNGMGLVGDRDDDPDLNFLFDNTILYDEGTRAFWRVRGGVEEQLALVNIGNARGLWSGPSTRTALAIAGSPATVAIDQDVGEVVNSVAYFSLTVDADCEIEPPTNCAVNDIIDILVTYEGSSPAHTITFGEVFGDATFPGGTDDGDRTRLRLLISAVDESGTAESVTVSQFTFASNDLVEDRGFNYVSGGDDNTAEPQIDANGDPVSTEDWTFVQLKGDQGEPGAAVVTATSTTSVAIGSGSKSFTLTETEERGFAIGTELRVASDANPVTHYMRGVVTAYTTSPHSITISVPADGFAGSGSRSDWSISLGGYQGADGTDPGTLLNWDTGTTDADPGAGNIRADNADLSAATTLYVSKSSRAGSDIEAFLLGLDDSDSTDKGGVRIKTTADGEEANIRISGVTDATGYVKIAIIADSHAGETSFTDEASISFEFNRTGDKGEAGASSNGVTDDSGVSGSPAGTVTDALQTLDAKIDTKIGMGKAIAAAIVFG